MAVGETGPLTAKKGPDNRVILQWTLRLIPAALLLAFILLNRQEVEINFWLWQVRTSLIWALTFTAALGIVLGYLARHFKKDRRAAE